MTSRHAVVLVLVVAGCLQARVATGQDVDEQTLKGLPGGRVVVEVLDPGLEGAGVREADLQSDVERQLEAAGIQVLTDEEWLRNPAGPYLYVGVTASQGPDPSISAYGLDIQFRQIVTLASGARAVAATWQAGGVGIVGGARSSELRDVLKDRMGEFTRAWSSVNPR